MISKTEELVKKIKQMYHNPRIQEMPDWYDILLLCDRIEKLEIALRKIAAVDSFNDFTDSIVDIAQEALEKKT